jgi:DNA primase large subunit
MQQLHHNLRISKHLKYEGRQQYGTFLKSISMSLEEALAFWRRSFVPRIDEASFAKNYAYNVRHLYGQEGKRVPAPHLTCMKMIAVGLENAHGCPFRHLREEKLIRMVNEYAAPNQVKLDEVQVNELVEMVRGKHYQLACTKLFELTRHINKMDTITHPHLFFQRSVEEHKEDELF